MKKLVSVALAAFMLFGLAACSGTASPDGSGATGQSAASNNGKREVVEFWYHDGNIISNEIYEKLIADFNASQDKYEAKYVSFPTAEYLQKLNLAKSTDTLPDVISLRLSDVTTLMSQDILMPVDEVYNNWAEKDNILSYQIDYLTKIGGGKLYGIPICYNQETAWYNTKAFEENKITPPATQKEFLQYAKEFAKPAAGKYFYSLRGNKPLDNLTGFIFTYAGTDSYFDENGKCVINSPKFVEGLETYASIYYNKWVSQSSVTNGFNEMVAEFAAGSAMYINHNSSSVAEHLKNLGAGNFANAKPAANDKGDYYVSMPQPTSYGIVNKKNNDGAVALALYLSSTDAVSRLCEVLGRVPSNTGVYEKEWYKNDPYMGLYVEMAKDSHCFQIQHPFWLPNFSDLVNNTMTTDFQALLLGEKTAQQVLDGWAKSLEAAQAEYSAQ